VEIEFRAKHLHMNLPKTNQKEKLRYDMCISCWLTVTHWILLPGKGFVSISLEIAFWRNF